MTTGSSVLKELSKVYIIKVEEIDAAVIIQMRRIFITK